jgi:hypothetical protein
MSASDQAKAIAKTIADDPSSFTDSDGQKCFQLVKELVTTGLIDISKPRIPRGLGLQLVATVLDVSYDDIRGTVYLFKWKAAGNQVAAEELEDIKKGSVNPWAAYTAICHKNKKLRDLKKASKVAKKKEEAKKSKEDKGPPKTRPVPGYQGPSLGAVQLISGPEMVVAHLNDIGSAFSALGNCIDSFQRKLVSGGKFGAFIKDELVPKIYEAHSAFLTQREEEYAQQLALSEILRHTE